jgi:uncharacterized protein (TIGR00369 family)
MPHGFSPAGQAGAFLDHIGPVLEHPDGRIGLQADDRHRNRAGAVMGGVLATLADAAFGRAIRGEADADAVVTVSLTTDFLRPAPDGAWLEARTEVERAGGRLAFADCSLTADGEEVVRARAVFAVLD